MSLRSYIIARVLLTLPMVLFLLTIVFLVVRVLPGDPVQAHFERNISPEAMAAMSHALGTDKPLFNQFLDYFLGLFQGNLGKSMQDFSSVSEQVFSAFPATLELALYSMVIAVIVGVLLGVRASQKFNSAEDHSIRGFGIVSYAIPVFYLGMVFQLVFSIGLHWFPSGGRTFPGMEPLGLRIGDDYYATGLYTIDSLLEGNLSKFVFALRYLALPTLTLGVVLCGIFLRLTRSNMLDTMRMDFVTAARARGLSEQVIRYGYGLRNAFLPVLTLVGLQFAALLAGAVLTETTFSWPGLGRYLVERISFRDYTAIQGAVVFFALLVAGVSLVIDVLYAYLDPRIRL